ncbi:hypothetical protein ACQEVF_51730 [Nonomuraea polychroma]|uniref:WDGH domain-containing protein n=1 Tax=Nonomuraea polychroma TaxID=46176 RepID=UPI003D9165FC
MTPEEAAENAATALDEAQKYRAFPTKSAALVAVADGWTRLHTALANAPKAIEPGQVEPAPEGISVYRERAHLVAYLATVYPSVLSYNDPNKPEWPVIYLGAERGQFSWHIAPEDLDLFQHVQVVDPDAIEWDGHTTAEKYERLTALSSTDQ